MAFQRFSDVPIAAPLTTIDRVNPVVVPPQGDELPRPWRITIKPLSPVTLCLAKI